MQQSSHGFEEVAKIEWSVLPLRFQMFMQSYSLVDVRYKLHGTCTWRVAQGSIFRKGCQTNLTVLKHVSSN